MNPKETQPKQFHACLNTAVRQAGNGASVDHFDRMSVGDLVNGPRQDVMPHLLVTSYSLSDSKNRQRGIEEKKYVMNQQLAYRQFPALWQWRSFSPCRVQLGIKCSLLIVLCFLASCAGANNSPKELVTPSASLTTRMPTSSPTSTVDDGLIHHYEYVFPDGGMYVYDMDHQHK